MALGAGADILGAGALMRGAGAGADIRAAGACTDMRDAGAGADMRGAGAGAGADARGADCERAACCPIRAMPLLRWRLSSGLPASAGAAPTADRRNAIIKACVTRRPLGSELDTFSNIFCSRFPRPALIPAIRRSLELLPRTGFENHTHSDAPDRARFHPRLTLTSRAYCTIHTKTVPSRRPAGRYIPRMPVPNLFAAPPRLPLIAPSVLSADFAHLADDCRSVLDQGADLLHLDVMDGHFVPNLTMGPDVCRALRRELPDAFLDVHLMVTDPAKYFEPFAKAGANHVSFHVEVVEPAHIEGLVKQAHALGMLAGLVINPPTPVERVLPHVALPDLVLVMSVNPGFSGQSFIPSALEKTRAIRRLLRPDQRLEMDGGISPSNAATVRDAGCDVMVAGSALMGVPVAERKIVISALSQRPSTT